MCILRTLPRHRCTSVFFEIWVLWGHAKFFVLFAFGCLGWLLLGWILASAGPLCHRHHSNKNRYKHTKNVRSLRGWAGFGPLGFKTLKRSALWFIFVLGFSSWSRRAWAGFGLAGVKSLKRLV